LKKEQTLTQRIQDPAQFIFNPLIEIMDDPEGKLNIQQRGKKN